MANGPQNGKWPSPFNQVAGAAIAPGRRILISDCTLRDGEQQAGVVLDRAAKVEIARALDGLGIYEIEAGTVASSEEDRLAMTDMVKLGLKAKISALCRGLNADMDQAAGLGVWGVRLSFPISLLERKHKLKGHRRRRLYQAHAGTVRLRPAQRSQRHFQPLRYDARGNPLPAPAGGRVAAGRHRRPAARGRHHGLRAARRHHLHHRANPRGGAQAAAGDPLPQRLRARLRQYAGRDRRRRRLRLDHHQRARRTLRQRGDRRSGDGAGGASTASTPD